MATISIFPDEAGFCAVSGDATATGRTVGQALDGLASQLPPLATTLVVIQPQTGDEFFSDDQRNRLAELMARWRTARDTGTEFPPADRAELDALIDAELQAATARTAALRRPGP